MKPPRTLRSSLSLGLMAAGMALAMPSVAADSPVIQGQDNWLFINYEIPLPELNAAEQNALNMIGVLNRALAKENVQLLVVSVPGKIDLYQEKLPPGFKVPDYMQQRNDHIHRTLRQLGVKTADIKPALRAAALKAPSSPIFYRLDTHWNPSGANIAAQVIKTVIDADPALKSAVSSVLPDKYTLRWADKKVSQTDMRDIVNMLPPGSSYAPEEVLRLTVERANASGGSLLGGPTGGDIVVVGSSFSGESSGFVPSLRYLLQRDVFNAYSPGDAGPWVMMLGYLQNDAYETKKPKLIIWEIPERAFSWAPSYPYRSPQYIMNDTVWLMQSLAQVNQTCNKTGIKVSFEPTGLLAKPGARSGAPTVEGDYLDMRLTPATNQPVYLSSRMITLGSRKVRVQTNAPAPMNQQQFTVAGDEGDHAVRIPLNSSGQPVDRIRIIPGATNSFALGDLEVCGYPAGVLP